MKNRLEKTFSSLFWRLSLIFLLVLMGVAALFLVIVSNTAEMYFQESAQSLNRPLAKRIVGEKDFRPFVMESGMEVNKAYLDSLFHNVMVYNPAVEAYLIDPSGQILSFEIPQEKVVLDTVDLGPIRQFLAYNEEKASAPEGTEPKAESFVAGTDPRNPGAHKPFSVHPIERDGELIGYIYVVLQSEEYEGVMHRLSDSYMLGLGTRSTILVLVVAILASLLLLWLLTRNLNRMVKVVRQFRQGDYQARVELKGRGELSQLANDFNQMADTTVQHIREIESVERLRRELIANVSHDLRTPLASIHGFAETLLMKEDDMTPEQRSRYTETILKGAERMKKLVDDLFELSKLEAREVSVQVEPFNLAELVYDISAKYTILAEQQGVQIETKVPQKVPLIRADIALMDRVLQNLVDNALKHTPTGGKVAIELVQKQGRMEVRVADTGVGIPEAELPYIFDRYRKAGSRKREGAGLGLAIVKKILEMHQAEIFVRSKENEGTEFWFNLQLG